MITNHVLFLALFFSWKGVWVQGCSPEQGGWIWDLRAQGQGVRVESHGNPQLL